MREHYIPFQVSSLKELYAYDITDISAAMGVFDGIHLGHRAIISKLMEVSSSNGSAPVVITFNPHPREFLGTDKNISMLRSYQEKIKILGLLGVKAVVVINFTQEIASMTPEKFIAHILDNSLCRLKAVCVGRRWHFGSGASGGVKELTDIGRKSGFDVYPVDELYMGKEKISSSSIRKALKNSDISLARFMLGDDRYKGQISL